MKRPILLVLISYILGILFFDFLKDESQIKFITFIVFSISIFFSFYFKMDKKIKIFTLLFFVGFFIMSLQKTEGNFIFNENVNLVGEVVSVKNSRDYSNYIVEVSEKDGEKFSEKILLTSNSDFKVGEILKISGTVREIKENTNPGLFNFKKYYENKKIFAKIFSNDIEVVGITRSLSLNIKSKFQNFVDNIFDKTLSENNSNIMKRIFLGNKYDFDFEEEVREIGLSHILAISGLHIGIIYILLFFIFKLLPVDRILREIFCILLVCIYSFLIGNPPSVIRAIVYITVIRYTKFSGRIVDNLSSLFLALFLILLFKPFSIYDVGLQLSFLSVLAIILIFPRIEKKKDNFILDSIKLTFSVLLLTAPIIFRAFGEVSILSFVGNLILIPFFIFVIILGFIMLIFGIFTIKISIFIGFFVDIILNLIRLNVEFLANLNIKFGLYNFNIFLIIFYYLIIYIFFSGLYRSFKIKDFKFLCISIIVTTICINFYHYNRNLVKVNFVDIGQGDSILVRGNGKNILIDTGGLVHENGNNGSSTLLPYLKKQGVKKLDFVFISHLDKDHCGNLKYLSENIKVENVIFRRNGYADYVNLYGNLNVKNVVEIETSSNLQIGSMNFDVFQVPNGFEENEKSIILNLTINNRKILFTGDIGAFTENQLLKRNIECDFLKVAHHGSKNSSSPEFLKATNCKVAIISCGENNNYGHPHKDTLNRLEDENIDVFRTDRGGNIILEIDRFSEKIVSYKNVNNNILEIFKLYKEDLLLINLLLVCYGFLIFQYRKYE